MNPGSSEKIVKTLWGMKKDRLAESTIEVTGRRLRLMAKSVDLEHPDAVTEYLAKKEGKSSYVESLANAYYRYAKSNSEFCQIIITCLVYVIMYWRSAFSALLELWDMLPRNGDGAFKRGHRKINEERLSLRRIRSYVR